MSETFWILTGTAVGVLIAVILACGLGYLTTRAEQEEDERLRHQLAWRENNRKMRGDE